MQKYTFIFGFESVVKKIAALPADWHLTAIFLIDLQEGIAEFGFRSLKY